jgi:hypothetical protein
MVTNSFGKRNFMQPMGRPNNALKVPCFFSLPQPNGCACVDFGCTHPIDGLF